MQKRVLFTIVALAFGLNMWLGERIPAGVACPLLISPSAAPLETALDAQCSRQCPIQRW